MTATDGGEPYGGVVSGFWRYGVNVLVDDADFDRATAGMHEVVKIRVMTEGLAYEFPEDGEHVWAEREGQR